jgi:hypothetical protein
MALAGDLVIVADDDDAYMHHSTEDCLHLHKYNIYQVLKYSLNFIYSTVFL